MAKWLLDVIIVSLPMFKSPPQYGQAEKERRLLGEKRKKTYVVQKKGNKVTFV